MPTVSFHRRCVLPLLRYGAASLLLCAILPLHAQQQDDLRRVLDQGLERRAIERERLLLKDEADTGDARPTITLDGKTYVVGNNANDVGRALYLSLQARDWTAAARFLDDYLQLPDRDPMLVHHAQGVLARLQGHHAEAEREFRAVLALQPDFLLSRLELGRVLFEDQQDLEAEALFASIARSIDAADPKTRGVLESIESFRAALRARRAWTGTVALGPGWSDNINRTSASRTCLLADDTGECYIERTLPAAIASTGLDFDATLSRYQPLRGHHGLYLRGLLFGQAHRDNSAYNELTSTVQAGYAWRNARGSVQFAPSFDYYAVGNTALYGAAGVHAEWNRTLSPTSMLKLEADWKDMRYRQVAYADYYDGATSTLSATWFHALDQLTVFGGVDLGRSDAREDTNAWRQRGVRVGTALQWPQGFSNTLFLSWRRRDHDTFNALIEARRRDNEGTAILVVRAERWAFAGLTPLLTLRHNRLRSNVDWLYSHDRNSVSLKFERAF